MDSEKYIGLDVHPATIVVAVTDSTGKLIMESILETKAATILQFFAGLRGTLSATFEEGTWSAWLYDCMSRRRLMYTVGTDPHCHGSPPRTTGLSYAEVRSTIRRQRY
jgi:hypothetical protein